MSYTECTPIVTVPDGDRGVGAAPTAVAQASLITASGLDRDRDRESRARNLVDVHSPSSAASNGKTGEHLMQRGVDFIFRCNHCIKMIPEGAPIYMRHDSSYCSTGCREKGVSALFTTLVNQQLRMLSERGGRHASLDGGDDAHSAAGFPTGLHSIRSDSSIHSRYSTVSDSTVKTGSDIQEASLPFRFVGYLGNKLLETIIPPVQRNPVGDTLLRTYSSGLVII